MSFLFTSLSILTSHLISSNQLKGKYNTHTHIFNNSKFPFISLHFSLSLLLSIERQQVITSRNFSSLLFTSLSILTSLALKNWKANTIHTHIQQLNISLHFSSLLTLTSIINWKANTVHTNILTRLNKNFNSSFIFVTPPDKFDILWNQGY